MFSSKPHLEPFATPGRAKRKLAAILSADVAGYSRLMGADETGTHERLRACRAVIDELIVRHDGRIVSTAGDSVLADFPSVIEALGAAIDIQKTLGEENATLPADQRLDFRIGINVGDVIVDGDDIFGDGVNVAARLEALAEPGGICISGKVYDEVKTKLKLGFHERGAYKVKNIAEPVRVYNVSGEGAATQTAVARGLRPRMIWLGMVVLLGVVAVATGLAQPPWLDRWLAPGARPQLESTLEAKPAIAVLPFDNRGGDADYFADGVTEDVITGLGRFSNLLVMSWNAVRAYKDQPVAPQDVGRELNVRYLVDGSVRRAGDRVRVTARLTDAERGTLLWSEQYDQDLDHIFALQDDITRQIVGTLAVRVTDLEAERAFAKPTESLAAYDLVLRGREQLRRRTREANIEARDLFQAAIEIDPGYASAYVSLAWTYRNDFYFGWSEWPDRAVERARRLAEKAIELDELDAQAHSQLGSVYRILGHYELARAELDRALQLNPNDPEIHTELGALALYIGHPHDAIVPLETARRFDPHIDPGWGDLAVAYYLEGRTKDAIKTLRQGLARHPDRVFAHVMLTAAYTDAGRSQDAARSAANVRRLSPFFKIERFSRLPYFSDPTHRVRVAAALSKAGLE